MVIQSSIHVELLHARHSAENNYCITDCSGTLVQGSTNRLLQIKKVIIGFIMLKQSSSTLSFYTMSGHTSLVFIPGAWHKPSCYDKVIQQLLSGWYTFKQNMPSAPCIKSHRK
ncbi:unnamed protein product [Fusarium graminearum]|nr:unnamed protein product [Fusarium graminearum]